MPSDFIKNLQNLDTLEKIQAVQDLWDSLAQNQADLPIPDWQIKQLDERKKNHKKNPKSVETWVDVKKSIINKND